VSDSRRSKSPLALCFSEWFRVRQITLDGCVLYRPQDIGTELCVRGTVACQDNDFTRRLLALTLGDDDDRGAHVEFDFNSLVVLERILEASECLTSQALDSFICCVLYHRIH
jgi:hypothetical protein